ncbi:hypothetical protein Tco_0762736 [Tanacetum coccineum]
MTPTDSLVVHVGSILRPSLPNLWKMSVDVDSTAHGVLISSVEPLERSLPWTIGCPITQLDNEIRNMAIGNLSITDFFQQLKSKADRLANLESPVKDTSLVTYAINGVRSKYPDAARVIRLREKAPTFDELRSLMLLEESDMSNSSHGFQDPSASGSGVIVPAISTLVTNTIPHFDLCFGTLSPNKWHRRLGHPSDDDVLRRTELGYRNLFSWYICKSGRLSGLFLSQSSFAEEILERAHTATLQPLCSSRILRYVVVTLTFGLQILAFLLPPQLTALILCLRPSIAGVAIVVDEDCSGYDNLLLRVGMPLLTTVLRTL